MADEAREHRVVAGAFSERVLGVAPGGWDNPAPCDGWVARDVVGHLVEWFPAFLKSGADIDLPRGPSVDIDPVAGPRVEVGSDADPQTRLLAFIGRNP